MRFKTRHQLIQQLHFVVENYLDLLYSKQDEDLFQNYLQKPDSLSSHTLSPIWWRFFVKDDIKLNNVFN